MQSSMDDDAQELLQRREQAQEALKERETAVRAIEVEFRKVQKIVSDTKLALVDLDFNTRIFVNPEEVRTS